jgi:CubicO group peptidase (beta-lactamase class C family)
MHHLIRTGITLVLLSFVPLSHAQTPPDLATRIDATVASYFKPDEPGVAVIVVKDGKPVYRNAYGMANIAGKAMLKPDSVFRLGSITKQFTSVAILMLAEDGRLAVGDDIRKHLPDYPTQGKTVTIEHLLTHTSGIVGYTSLKNFPAVMKTDMPLEQMIGFFKNEPFSFEPGERYEYSNSGYFLLGAIIENVSGMRYADFMAKRIFEPLGMKSTAYEGFERDGAKRVEGYGRSRDGIVVAEAISMAWPYSAGALLSNLDDMATWDAAITAGKLLKPASWKQAFSSYQTADGKPTGYGYGWVVRKMQGHDSIEHGGGIPGFSTHAMRMPEDKVYVAVLANSEVPAVRPNYLAEKIAAIAIGKPYPEFRPTKVDARLLDQLTGIYKIDERSTRIITRAGDQLVAQRTGGPKSPLLAASETKFQVPNSFTYVEFTKNDKGVVTHLTVFESGQEKIEPRISDKPPAEKQAVPLPASIFDTYVGEYQLAPNFILTISREGERFLSQATGQSKLEIFAESETRFFLKVIDAQLQFTRDANGNVTQLTLFQGGREMPAKKIR